VRAFRDAPQRPAEHSGSAYPDEAGELKTYLDEYLTPAENESAPLASPATKAIVAPHVSPFGGVEAYRAAYRALGPQDPDRTFVVLGTSHYGAPDRLGLTRKPFVTPYGETRTDLGLVDEIAHGADVLMEDYCHAIEHSIEFQCVFLQHVLGPGVRILPILCGSFFESLVSGKPPETNESVRRFLNAMGELAEQHNKKLIFVLGVDLAHIGRRYGDSFDAKAETGRMKKIHERDRERLDHFCRGDAEAFFELVKVNQDELRWCGYAPLYTFLKAVPAARGAVLNYEQWNIDEQSVVSCAALRFVRA